MVQARGPRRPPRKVKDERTKFDKWLDQMKDLGNLVTLHFEYPPLDVNFNGAEDEEENGETVRKATNQVVFILEVDRYMVKLGFGEGREWWVNKSIISAASEFDPKKDFEYVTE